MTHLSNGMEIKNCDLNDIPTIFEFYETATEFMKSKDQVAWPKFDRTLIEQEIEESRQWKLLINNEIACVWAIALNDELIWGKEKNEPSVYLHRIATSSHFRGQQLVNQIVKWAEKFGSENNLLYIRMDTVGLNQGLIKHYEKVGFSFLGIKELKNVNELPEHYSKGPVCLFQKLVKNRT